MKIIIGITDCSKWQNYHDWFAADEVQVVKLSSKENNVEDVDKCNGIVLSGGEDVHPKYYGYPEWMERKNELKLYVNEARDEFEMKVIDRAVKNKKPILGICRGLQIANVYYKGTLIPNLTPNPSPVGEGSLCHSKEKGDDQTHIVKVEANSCLSGIVKSKTGKTNSAHHQAADRIGNGLTVSARAEDGTVEAIEWQNPKDKPFLLLIQWHPERMKEQENPFAKNLKETFLEEVRKFTL
ncbi:MAG: gamma-glutamyl-gamma-aminobutyrate hydrolase family protein [Bacteroidetes bacterium]|nr:gamma-glutamyl-gamma-aminobutyrate hydrolase family protein [Bacteroidota bacterium]